jgi:hypothetical protein
MRRHYDSDDDDKYDKYDNSEVSYNEKNMESIPNHFVSMDD